MSRLNKFTASKQLADFLKNPIKGAQSGFTLIELLIATVIISILIAIALPLYRGIQEEVRVRRTIAELTMLQTEVVAYNLNTGTFPQTLGHTNTNIITDPYGNPYQYHLIETDPAIAKDDGFFIPINTDFDLYSLGKDGVTAQAIDDPNSLDDVVRVSDGSWFGLGLHF